MAVRKWLFTFHQWQRGLRRGGSAVPCWLCCSAFTNCQSHALVLQVTEETEEMRFNTALAAMMEFVNGGALFCRLPHCCLLLPREWW